MVCIDGDMESISCRCLAIAKRQGELLDSLSMVRITSFAERVLGSCSRAMDGRSDAASNLVNSQWRVLKMMWRASQTCARRLRMVVEMGR